MGTNAIYRLSWVTVPHVHTADLRIGVVITMKKQWDSSIAEEMNDDE